MTTSISGKTSVKKTAAGSLTNSSSWTANSRLSATALLMPSLLSIFAPRQQEEEILQPGAARLQPREGHPVPARLAEHPVQERVVGAVQDPAPADLLDVARAQPPPVDGLQPIDRRERHPDREPTLFQEPGRRADREP